MSEIGIIGAGISGLHLTLRLQQLGVPTVLYAEQGPDQIAGGRFSIRYIVTRLFVRQAAIRERPVSRSVGTLVHSVWSLDG